LKCNTRYITVFELQTQNEFWLLLLYGLPTKRTTARVNLWRKLKKFGAIQLKTSAWALPDGPIHRERFEWLATQIRDDGGEATLLKVAEIGELTTQQIHGLFNDARTAEYQELIAAIQTELPRGRKANADSVSLEKFQRRFHEIKQTDYFHCCKAHDAEMLLERASKLATGKSKNPVQGPKLNPKDFVGRTWLTRPRPGIDRVGSAWLIKRFIDPKASFVFGMEVSEFPNALPFDMVNVEFSHHGDNCTFETLVKRFELFDKTVLKIAEMIHDADLEDGKFQRSECLGIGLVLQGWARIGLSDQDLLKRGGECFEALYQQLKK